MRYIIVTNGKISNVAVSDEALAENWYASKTGNVGDLYDTDTDTITKVASIPTLNILEVSQWTIPADGVTPSVLTYTSDSTVNFVVDGEVIAVDPVDYVATLEVAADAQGAIQIQVRDRQILIVAEAV